VVAVPVLLLAFSAKTNCPKLKVNRSASTILNLLITIFLLSLSKWKVVGELFGESYMQFIH
jgi:hypothetical protein